MKIMVWNAARGGMRSVVEAYQRDGFLNKEDVTLVTSYVDGGFLHRQLILLKGLFQFLVLLVTKRIELVHVHSAMRGSFWRKSIFARLARLFGVPVLLHLHGSEMKPFYERQSPSLKREIQRQLEKATRVVVLSESWREFIAQIAPAARITVVPNYVTMPALPPATARDPHKVLFLGLIGQRKGTFDLIPAFAAVSGHPDVKLVIGGNGQIEEARAAVADCHAQSRIELAGWVSGDAKEAHLMRSGIYVLPSYNEGLPMSVLEAMAAGLAVITTRVGGIPELITHGVDGLLVEAGDRQALTSAVQMLLDDEPLRQRIAEAGRLRVEQHYSDRAVLPLLHRLYADCARGQQSGRPSGRLATDRTHATE